MFEPVSELMEPLLLCYRSLHATGNGIIADGRLTDVLRRMAAVPRDVADCVGIVGGAVLVVAVGRVVLSRLIGRSMASPLAWSSC